MSRSYEHDDQTEHYRHFHTTTALPAGPFVQTFVDEADDTLWRQPIIGWAVGEAWVCPEHTCVGRECEWADREYHTPEDEVRVITLDGEQYVTVRRVEAESSEPAIWNTNATDEELREMVAFKRSSWEHWREIQRKAREKAEAAT